MYRLNYAIFVRNENRHETGHAMSESLSAPNMSIAILEALQLEDEGKLFMDIYLRKSQKVVLSDIRNDANQREQYTFPSLP